MSPELPSFLSFMVPGEMYLQFDGALDTSPYKHRRVIYDVTLDDAYLIASNLVRGWVYQQGVVPEPYMPGKFNAVYGGLVKAWLNPNDPFNNLRFHLSPLPVSESVQFASLNRELKELTLDHGWESWADYTRWLQDFRDGEPFCKTSRTYLEVKKGFTPDQAMQWLGWSPGSMRHQVAREYLCI